MAREEDAKAMNVYWSPFSGLSPRSLLLADERPKFVALDTTDPQADHDAVVQLGTAATDLGPQSHDRVAVYAGHPFGGADAQAFGQTTDDRNLLIARNDVHIDTAPDNLISNTVSRKCPLSIIKYRI